LPADLILILVFVMGLDHVESGQIRS